MAILPRTPATNVGGGSTGWPRFAAPTRRRSLPLTHTTLCRGFGSNLVSLSSAELYDPAAGNWSSTGSLGTARWQHTATLLANGKVLVSGVRDRSGVLSSAEV